MNKIAAVAIFVIVLIVGFFAAQAMGWLPEDSEQGRIKKSFQANVDVVPSCSLGFCAVSGLSVDVSPWDLIGNVMRTPGRALSWWCLPPLAQGADLTAKFSLKEKFTGSIVYQRENVIHICADRVTTQFLFTLGKDTADELKCYAWNTRIYQEGSLKAEKIGEICW